MTKRELIDQILAANCTAAPEFLAKFDDSDLQEYLDHLYRARQPRLSGADPRRYEKYFRCYQPSSPAAAPARRLVGASTWRASQPLLTPLPRAQAQVAPVQEAQEPQVEGTYVSQADVPAIEDAEEPAVGLFESEQAADLIEDSQIADAPPRTRLIPAPVASQVDRDDEPEAQDDSEPPFAQQSESQEQQNWLF